MSINKYLTIGLTLLIWQSDLGFSQMATPVKTKKLWKQWYTYSLNGAPKGIYREEFHEDPQTGEVVVYQKINERTDSHLKSTTVISTANNDIDFSPVKFYVKQKFLISKGMMSQYKIFEGVESSGNVGVRIHDSNIDSDPQQLMLAKKDKFVFGAFLPMYLSKLRATKRMTDTNKATFSVLLEEGDNSKFQFNKIEALVSKQSSITFDAMECFAYDVIFDSIPSVWWISASGKLCQMQINEHGVLLKMATQSEAKSYL